ncbi:MAG: hypothetical protein ETSY1_01835 [Candidatus Entotheonella factor]|uniref:Uncharacterized protein n=1 Tax=Entotheonella factor TaxID=1429438 RepID=W4LYF5_ENTF1|nr:MAG: hypothetical protein ETSY1_01835 [Candidatus Entotheonella factor]
MTTKLLGKKTSQTGYLFAGESLRIEDERPCRFMKGTIEILLAAFENP